MLWDNTQDTISRITLTHIQARKDCYLHITKICSAIEKPRRQRFQLVAWENPVNVKDEDLTSSQASHLHTLWLCACLQALKRPGTRVGHAMTCFLFADIAGHTVVVYAFMCIHTGSCIQLKLLSALQTAYVSEAWPRNGCILRHGSMHVWERKDRYMHKQQTFDEKRDMPFCLHNRYLIGGK